MPQTSDEHRARWPGGLEEVTTYLTAAGWTLDSKWVWRTPQVPDLVSDIEWDAINYCAMEWDYAGGVAEGRSDSPGPTE